MTTFLDSSALVKLYAPEEGYEHVEALAPPLVISQLSRVEVHAAFRRKHRVGELSAESTGVLASLFEADLAEGGSTPPRFVIVPVGDGLLDRAVRLVAQHPLRAYDAIQLATAVLAQRALDAPLSFAAFDKSLRAAATIEGLTVVPR